MFQQLFANQRVIDHEVEIILLISIQEICFTAIVGENVTSDISSIDIYIATLHGIYTDVSFCEVFNCNVANAKNAIHS